MTAVLHAIRRALVGTGSTALTLIGACLIGFGVPLFWIWLASRLYDKPGAVNGAGRGLHLHRHPGQLLGAAAARSWIRGRMLGRSAEPVPRAPVVEPQHARLAPTGPAITAATRSSGCS